jgi:FkbM family methyltransferase
MSMMYTALAALRRAGLEVSHARPNLVDFLQSRSIDCVLDVGANAGQFGRWLRNHGYAGRIISFEPIPAVYQLLLQEASGDGTKNLAIGNHCVTAIINVGSNSALSSLLSVSELVPSDSVRSFKERNETVAITTLDVFCAELSETCSLRAIRRSSSARS